MKTDPLTPLKIFRLSQHFNVPLFQRRYVWDAEEQWAPLWQDIRRTTQLRLSGTPSARHFLGAIVLQSLGETAGQVQQWSVIDGQQRLTTLQLLMDAAASQLEDRGQQRFANRLRKLTHNDEDDLADPEDVLKVRHGNADHDPYVEVMEAPAPVDHGLLEHADSRLARAHAYFSTEVETWLGGGDGSEDDVSERAEALVDTLANGLQIVTITLTADEDSQEIFETLNARGTPLTAADLIKNLLFQRLTAEGVDEAAAYRDYWRLFETPFWEKEISIGRLLQPRSAVFLRQWLVSRTGEDLGAQSLFGRFKHFVDHEYARSALDLLKLLHGQAVIYEGWTKEAYSKNPNLDQVPLAIYRMDAANLEVAKPLLIWLHEPDHPKPAAEVRIAIAAVESWLMRRMMMRLSTSDLGRVVANLVANYRGTPVEGLGERVRDQLAHESTASTYWPGDADVRAALSQLPAYRAYGRGRLRMMLEAVEDSLRGFTGDRPSRTGSRITRNWMHIEHLLPRSWKKNWPVVDLAAELDRNQHVHRLGNLTLLTQSLNSEVSNGPWTGPMGKHAALRAQDVCLMTRDVRQQHAEGWTEADIDARGAKMVDALLATWPVPDGHEGRLEDSVPVSSYVSIGQVVAAGLLTPGTDLVARDPDKPTARVTKTGLLEVDGQEYETLSGAGKAVLGRNVNGWYYWRMPDGRRLLDIRDDYLRQEPSDPGHARSSL